jgi:hypothetical protein
MPCSANVINNPRILIGHHTQYSHCDTTRGKWQRDRSTNTSDRKSAAGK